jgi:hypothetical protein
VHQGSPIREVPTQSGLLIKERSEPLDLMFRLSGYRESKEHGVGSFPSPIHEIHEAPLVSGTVTASGLYEMGPKQMRARVVQWRIDHGRPSRRKYDHDLSHSFAISGIAISKSGEVKIPERKSVEMHLKIGVGSWPWVILRMEPEEKEASLQALESTWSSPVYSVSTTLHGRSS